MLKRTAFAAALALPLLSAGALADDAPAADVCTAPGPELLNDPSGDVAILLNGASLPIGDFDLLALNVAQAEPAADGGLRLAFTLTVGSTLPVLPPSTIWVASFQAPNRQTYAVRMVTDETGLESFDTYVPDADSDGGTDGQFYTSTKPAEPESNYADGVITIVVKASDVGVRAAGDELNKFGALATPAVGIALGSPLATTGGDEMPDDLARRGSYVVTDCGAGSKSLVEKFGGALNGALLLPLLGLAALRRRKTA